MTKSYDEFKKIVKKEFTKDEIEGFGKTDKGYGVYVIAYGEKEIEIMCDDLRQYGFECKWWHSSDPEDDEPIYFIEAIPTMNESIKSSRKPIKSSWFSYDVEINMKDGNVYHDTYEGASRTDVKHDIQDDYPNMKSFTVLNFEDLSDKYSDPFFSSHKSVKSAHFIKSADNYGWVVDSSDAMDALDMWTEYVGAENALEDIARALSTDDLKENLEWICRQWGFAEEIEDMEDEWEQYEYAKEVMGADELLTNLSQAIGYDELAECMAYIFRMNDFREWDKRNGYDEDDEDDEEIDSGCHGKSKKNKKSIKSERIRFVNDNGDRFEGWYRGGEVEVDFVPMNNKDVQVMDVYTLAELKDMGYEDERNYMTRKTKDFNHSKLNSSRTIKSSYQVGEFEDVPQWAINYLAYGDTAGLTDEDYKNVGEWMKEVGVSTMSLLSVDSESYFSNHPQFGLPTDCVTATFSLDY